MKPQRRIEKFLERIDVIPDAEAKRLHLEDLLAARDRLQRPNSAQRPPTIRSIIMNRKTWKAAAALVFATAVIGVIGILQNGDQAAYAFGQTVAAMQGGHSYHIQTYYGAPDQRHDEFWAEFDAQGQLTRVRQLDQWKKEDRPVEVLWANQVEYTYTPGRRLLVIRKTQRHVDEDRLEEFNPETMIEEAYQGVENGEATVKIVDPLNQNGELVFEVTGNHPYRYVICVDPETNVVRHLDQYGRDDEGNEKYNRGIDVLEYNQAFGPALFDPDAFLASLPDDTIVIDQISKPVGLAQGDLSPAAAAAEVVRQALEALAAEDYEAAGLLFGGAPREYFSRRRGVLPTPLADIAVGEPRPHEWYGPTFMVPCSCTTELQGQPTTVKGEFWVITGQGPAEGHWFIKPTYGSLSIEE